MTMRPDILTCEGDYFDFLHPERSRITPTAIAHGLSNICRFGGQSLSYYSVAQHCVLASRIVPREHAFPALMHDAAEAYVGDIPSPLKQLIPDFKVIERRVEAAIASTFSLTLPLADEVKRADLILLATEQRDLMPAHDDEWALIKGVEMMAEPVIPWSQDGARRAWLGRFNELFKAGDWL